MPLLQRGRHPTPSEGRTRGAPQALGIEPLLVDAGPRITPKVPRPVLPSLPGRCTSAGRALPYPSVRETEEVVRALPAA